MKGRAVAKKKQPETLGQQIVSLFWALLLVLGIHTFLFKPYVIPSDSMKPGLLIGDFLFVSKYQYGYSKYSIPFAPPLFSGRITGFFSSEPKRGEVVVFTPPHQQDEVWIKRLIGLPGDRIQMKEGVLYINGQACPLTREEDFVDHLKLVGSSRQENRVYSEEGEKVPRYVETLPGDLKHTMLKDDPFGQGRLDNTREFLVPEGHYFMMGDNRDHSGDSRLEETVGFIPAENLVGRAELIFFSTTARWWEVWKWPTAIRYKRLFKLIK
ncbi:MAG: signal peptidase I [Alphaproteobacteria bacterium]|nr:signal peptidase I [Alphaproteobacteria bacterium]